MKFLPTNLDEGFFPGDSDRQIAFNFSLEVTFEKYLFYHIPVTGNYKLLVMNIIVMMINCYSLHICFFYFNIIHFRIIFILTIFRELKSINNNYRLLILCSY